MTHAIQATVFLCCVLCCAVHVQAQTKLEPEVAKQVQDLVELGMDAFTRKDYDQAISAFERGYDLSGAPQFLLNIAVARQRLGQHQDSEQMLERVILHPQSSDAQRATAQGLRRGIGTLTVSRALAEARPAPAAPALASVTRPAAGAPTHTGWSGLQTTGAIVLAGGVAGLGTSFWLDRDLGPRLDQLGKLARQRDEQAYLTLREEVEDRRHLIFFSGGLGAALVLGGALLMVYGGESEAPASVQWQLLPSPRGATLLRSF